jgi:outer membrane protein TolC
VSLANLRPEVIKAENAKRLALNGLKVALGIQYEMEIEAADTLQYEPVAEESISDVTQAVLKENPSLSALRLQTQVNDAIVSAERSGFLPTLSAFGNYQLVSQNNQFRFSTGDFFPSSQVGLSLQFNIFNGLQTTARVDQAQLEMRKSQEQTVMLETTLQVSVESILLNMRRAQERIASQGRAVEQAERGYRIATTRYNNGAGTQLEVNDARLALSVAKVNRMEAMYDYLVGTADLDQALGRLPGYAETNTKAE